MSRQCRFGGDYEFNLLLNTQLANNDTNSKDTSQLADAVEVCDPIHGVSVSSNSEVTALTNFINEACDQVSIRSAGYTRLNEMYHDVSNVNDVKDYFIRPKLLNTITYNSATRGSLATYDVSAANTAANVYNFARIAGTYGWRATFCFRLQAISNPFQAGIVRMAFSPFEGIGNEAPSRISTITPISQLPGVELDLAQNTSVVLKIPFIYCDNYFTYVAPAGYNQSLGYLGVFAYTPITIAAGTPAPTLALWHWLEDFELISATAADVVQEPAFAADSTTKLVSLPPISEDFVYGEYTPTPFLTFVPEEAKFETQMGKLDASSKESKAIPGNISNVLAAGSNLVSWAASRVPMISSFAGGTSWFLRETAKIAASYGWSKPLITTPHKRVIDTTHGYQNNSDGPDPSYNLGLFSDNTIAPLPGFAGTNVDEMSLSYINSVFSAISVATLSTTDAVGAYVKIIECAPTAMIFDTLVEQTATPPISIASAFRPSATHAVANCFNRYRGSFVFRVKIAKTKFHTGRIILGFTPYRHDPTKVTRPLDPTNMQFKSLIWDLREDNVVDFVCPFTSPLSYLDIDESYGTFFISILEPLKGPDTVSQTVPIVIEVAGAPDMEYADPCMPRFVPAPISTPFYTQSGDVTVFNSAPEQEPSLYCMGERVNSVKQLISRACPLLLANASGTYIFQPDRYYPVWSGFGLTNYFNTYLNYFMCFYGMYRGGYHYHAVPNGDACLAAARTHIAGPVMLDSLVQEANTSLHVKMPYYNKRSRSIITGPTGQFPVDNPMYLYSSRSNARGAARSYVTIRAADDFQFGYFLGAPAFANAPAPADSANTLFVVNMATSR